MSILHKKREAFRQSIRSKSIHQLFHRKRLQLLQQLKKHNQKQHQTSKLRDSNFLNQDNQLIKQQSQQIASNLSNYSNIKDYLINCKHELSRNNQTQLFESILKASFYMVEQKFILMSKLINRRQFCLNEQIQLKYGWRKLAQDFLFFISQNNENKSQQKLPLTTLNQSQSYKKVQFRYLSCVSICFSLIKIWQLKPKYQIFLIFPKSYTVICQKISNALGLTLIAQLTYEKSLQANSNFIYKILQINMDRIQEDKFFRILQILKNFIFNLDSKRTQIHLRQLIFEYINWIKKQTAFLVYQEYSLNNPLQQQKLKQLPNQIGPQTKYCLIYLLFITLNQLSEVNQQQKQNYSTKQILIMNEQLFNHSQNQTILKFLVQQGKKSKDNDNKGNIFKTLSYLLSFLQILNYNQQKQQKNTFQLQFQEIHRTFFDTELNWFETFN